MEYLIKGDLWDYLCLEHQQIKAGTGLFLPMTLEMGSWLWLRKNPRHLFSRHGLFHPLLPHRRQRILRRHFTLFEFLFRSLLNPEAWACLDSEQISESSGRTVFIVWRLSSTCWLLLRGLTRESAHWGEFIPKLQAAFPDVQIHTLDLPGTGADYQGSSPASIKAITAQVRQFAKEKDWLDRPVNQFQLPRR